MNWDMWTRKKNTYQVDNDNLVKIPIWVIFIRKYVPLLLLFLLLNTYTFHHDSLIGFGLGGIVYFLLYGNFWIFSKLKIHVNWIFISLVIQVVMVSFLIYLGLFVLGTHLGIDTGFGYILNYLIQSLLWILLFHLLFVDFISKSYKNYYRSKIQKNIYLPQKKYKKNMSKKFGIFGSLLLILSLFSLTLGTPSYLKTLVFKIEHKKMLEKKVLELQEKEKKNKE